MGVSSACSVMETTRMPRLRSMDLKATACSRLRVNRENFQTRISLKGASGLAASFSIFWNSGPVGDAAALGLVHVLAGDQVVVLLGVVPERPKLGGDGQVHVLAVAGHSCVEGHWRQIESVIHQSLLLVFHSVLSGGSAAVPAAPVCATPAPP